MYLAPTRSQTEIRITGTAGVPPAQLRYKALLSTQLFALRAHCGRDARGPSIEVSAVANAHGPARP
jgi:hypothetical protein